MPLETTRLPSGLVVVTDEIHHVATAAVEIVVRAGGRNEADHEHGISHLLEHMAFKGTASRSASDISDQIESVGGALNAATTEETTHYEARTLKEDVPLALELMADAICNSTFADEDLAIERDVISQEIASVADTPPQMVFEILTACCYPDQPIGRSLLGTQESIASIEALPLRRYMAAHYRAPEITIAAAGAIDHAAIVEAASRLFASLPNDPAPPPAPAAFVGGASKTVAGPFTQTHLVVGFEGLHRGHPDKLALQAFGVVVGGSPASRLFQEIRDSRGLCYDIQAMKVTFADSGMFCVYTATAPERSKETCESVFDILRDTADTLTPKELARFKAQARASLLMSLERCVARAHRAAVATLHFGRPLTTEEAMARIDDLTVERIRDAAWTMLGRSAPTIVALGPGPSAVRTTESSTGSPAAAARVPTTARGR